jgi:hypothetical protein
MGGMERRARQRECRASSTGGGVPAPSTYLTWQPRICGRRRSGVAGPTRRALRIPDLAGGAPIIAASGWAACERPCIDDKISPGDEPAFIRCEVQRAVSDVDRLDEAVQQVH